MIRLLLLLIIISITTETFAKNEVKVYYEKADFGYRIYADNDELCPVSIKFEFELTNLKAESEDGKVYLLEPDKKGQYLFDVRVIEKGKAYRLSYRFWNNIGDVLLEEYDEEYEYYLPFKKSESYKLWQGYDGSFSHQGKNSLDFTMDVGTPVAAMRDGLVVKVEESNSKNCDTKDCIQYNNFIIVYHSDGTFAEYTHIEKNGSKVKVGDRVKQGQIIASSGNVGFSSGPHLHVVVFLPRFDDRLTLKTKFLVGDGGESIYLEEKQIYSRNY